MITDDERREAAQRLRELNGNISHVRRVYEAGGFYIFCDDQADYYQICYAIAGYLPAEHMHPCDYEELHERLADLIEPNCDALQETADENAAAYADAETMQDERNYKVQARVGNVLLESNNGYALLDAMLEMGA